jgi:hypothetical protein
MRWATVENDIITNIVVVGEDTTGFVEVNPWLNIGDNINALEPEPTILIPAITARQFLAALAITGYITTQEALDRSIPPAAIEAVFSMLPAQQQVVARITWGTMTSVARDELLVQAVIAAGFINPATSLPVTSSEVDELFLLAATL